MRLADFILKDMDRIIEAWVDFARTVDVPQAPLGQVELRDHAEGILRTVALDMQSPQTSRQQQDKSRGLGPATAQDAFSKTHAVMRHVSGFSLDQMVSEYRALRSSVLRLWLAQGHAGEAHELDDMVRFNEAIDQALIESISAYEQSVEVTRKMVLGVLGHDLRTPLGAALLGAQMLRRKTSTDREMKITDQIISSVERANQIVESLLDLARVNFGGGIPIHKEAGDLKAVCVALVAELRSRYPQSRIAHHEAGVVVGDFDPVRMGQVFSNMIGNAVQHGDPQQPITVRLERAGSSARFSVHNHGEPIPADAMPHLFSPQGRYSRYASGQQDASGGLGLGLFIANEIVTAHGGTIEVRSTRESGTVFHASIPLG